MKPEAMPDTNLPPMLFRDSLAVDDALLDLQADWYADEAAHCRQLRQTIPLDRSARERTDRRAVALVRKARAGGEERSSISAFMLEYDLSSEEGIVLMCLAEALLRIPDADTAEKLIADKLGSADWERHLGQSSSLFVNASTWGLMLTGRLIGVGRSTQRNFTHVLGRLINRSGEPFVRMAIRQAMRIMGHQFVMGRNIEAALERSRGRRHRGFRHSFDMLGEGALTAEDAGRYLQAYHDAIDSIGSQRTTDDIYAADSISVKLSALHPRYEYAQRERVLKELPPQLLQLAEAAARHGIALTVDAEEADRLALSLEVFARVADAASIRDWQGLGLAIQAYQKRCWKLIGYLEELARRSGRRLPVRLVKGAYWDSEIKLAQHEGLPDYPVFTRKVNTDISYLACAARLLQQPDCFYPQFATHNAHTIAAVRELAGERGGYEFQRLHGMGEELYDALREDWEADMPCRVYAPVGEHKDLLPYLVRRLLENGANTSFVNRINDEQLAPEQVVSDPLAEFDRLAQIRHPGIPLPVELFGNARRNAAGLALRHEPTLVELQQNMRQQLELPVQVYPLVGFERRKQQEMKPVTDPADQRRIVSRVDAATAKDVEQAIAVAREAVPEWQRTAVETRAAMLEQAADSLHRQRALFLALAVLESGQTIAEALSEVREAENCLRYYASQARSLLAEPENLHGPTGELNQLYRHGRGLFACISPRNSPLAVCTGQVAAALVAGNGVIAKPSTRASASAFEITRILHAAGVPRAALQMLPGAGNATGAALVRDPRIDGVAFTGTTATAQLIRRVLARHGRDFPVLIAACSGQNAMIVDSSALPEQVIRDVIQSAFAGAGLSSSALRVLYVQEDIAEPLLAMLAGAMQELKIGLPTLLDTDCGPVTDDTLLQTLQAQCRKLDEQGRLVAETPLPADLLRGCWFAPCAWEIDTIGQLDGAILGPILHVIRFRAQDLDRIVDEIIGTGYGLSLGIHSRIDAVHKQIGDRIRSGNVYVNRRLTGASAGVQPYGGAGLSGTGPKAGGPWYVQRFCAEKTLTINTAAVGGNASLLAMSEEA